MNAHAPDSTFNGYCAMSIERGFCLGNNRLIIVRFFMRIQRPSINERNFFLENGVVAGSFDIAAGYVRQPKKIVGTQGANTSIGRWMPPMLNIALDELPAG